MLIIYSILFIIPDISKNIWDYKSEAKILKNTAIENKAEININRIPRNGYTNTLVLTMTDNTEWYISNQYSDYWKKLENPSNVGKNIKWYWLSNNNYNPVQIEIDNKIIYDLNTHLKWGYIFLIITLLLTISSVIKLRSEYFTNIKNS